MKFLDDNGLLYLWQKITKKISSTSQVLTNSVVGYTGDTIPEGYEETDAPLKEIYNAVYPIGRGFIDFTDTDYSNYLGFTWERELVGMTPIGKDENDTDFATIGATGGSKTKTITKANLPNYNLTVTDPGHLHVAYNTTDTKHQTSEYEVATTENNAYLATGRISRNTSTAKTGITVNSGGSGTALDVMNPYQVVSYWKRIA